MHDISAKDTNLFDNTSKKPAIYFVQERKKDFILGS